VAKGAGSEFKPQHCKNKQTNKNPLLSALNYPPENGGCLLPKIHSLTFSMARN
jgi:hypothetical protein